MSSRLKFLNTPPQHRRWPSVRRLSTQTESTQTLHGHTFGDTVIQGHAFAHFGDSYTNYHIYNAYGESSSAKRGSLTIAQVLTGILAASARAITFISMWSKSTPTLQVIKEEFVSLGIILSSLQTFIDDSSSANSERASLVELEDIVTVMTQLALLYPEFEVIIDENVRYGRGWRLASDSGRETSMARLLDGLQRHKSTLSIILQILQWFVLDACGPHFC